MKVRHNQFLCVYFVKIRYWDKEKNDKKCASLFMAIAKTFWKEYTILALLCLVNDVVLKIVQPQLFRRFLQYFKYDTFNFE